MRFVVFFAKETIITQVAFLKIQNDKSILLLVGTFEQKTGVKE